MVDTFRFLSTSGEKSDVFREIESSIVISIPEEHREKKIQD